MDCVVCGSEILGIAQECPDCGADLEQASEATEHAQYWPLTEVDDVDAFGSVTSLLEEAGIPWFVESAAHAVRLFVARRRLDEAADLLSGVQLTAAMAH
jgi:hypothetical protein